MKRFGMFALSFSALLLAGTAAQAAMHDEEGGDKKFSIHGEVRFRGEGWSNLTDFTDTRGNNTDDDFDIWPWRVRLAAKGDLGHDIWVYGEFQGAGVAGGGVFGENNPFFGDDAEVLGGDVSIYQGWVKVKDLGNTVLDLTFGRQEIVFDRGLHFSAQPFYTGIHHDGVSADWDWDNFGVHGFWIRNTEMNSGIGLGCSSLSSGPPSFLCTNTDADNDTLGVHFKHTLGDEGRTDVAYYLFLQTQNATAIDSSVGEERGKIYTLGGRWGHWTKGENGWIWNLEAAVQSGDFQPCAAPGFFGSGTCTSEALDQKSLVFEGSGGYVWHSGKTDQKLWGGYTMASGDDDPNDDDQEAYVPLFTDVHNRLGYADLWAMSNITAYSAGYKANIDDRHTFGATLWQFNKTEDEGTSFSPVTGMFIDCTPPVGSTCDDDLGQELDLFYGYNLSSNFGFDVAWSIFKPGDAVEDHFNGFGFNNDGEDNAWRLTGQARARW